jgi:large subunit ribosomal protein L29
MKTKKFITETRGKSAAELAKLATELREKLRATRLDIVTGKSKNVSSVRKVRKDLARVLSISKEPNTK